MLTVYQTKFEKNDNFQVRFKDLLSNQFKDPPKIKLESLFMQNKDTRRQTNTFFKTLTHLFYLNYTLLMLLLL